MYLETLQRFKWTREITSLLREVPYVRARKDRQCTGFCPIPARRRIVAAGKGSLSRPCRDTRSYCRYLSFASGGVFRSIKSLNKQYSADTKVQTNSKSYRDYRKGETKGARQNFLCNAMRNPELLSVQAYGFRMDPRICLSRGYIRTGPLGALISRLDFCGNAAGFRVHGRSFRLSCHARTTTL